LVLCRFKVVVGTPPGSMTRRSVGLGLALVFLDASVTFRNVWPMPAIQWRGDLSIELAIGVLVMALISSRRKNANADTPGAHGAPATLRPFDNLRAAPSKVEGRQAQGRPEHRRRATERPAFAPEALRRGAT